MNDTDALIRAHRLELLADDIELGLEEGTDTDVARLRAECAALRAEAQEH